MNLDKKFFVIIEISPHNIIVLTQGKFPHANKI